MNRPFREPRTNLAQLPPMTALRAFVAVAQHGSFIRAGEALHVTPAAIGQQIRQLEAHIGTQLFRRDRGQALEPTEVAQKLLPGLVEGFASILAAVDRLSESEEALPLRISVAPSFALKWLLPRLDRLRARHPEFDVRIATTTDLVDFSRDEADCAIRFGAGSYSGLHSEILLSDYVVPVCSPALLRGPFPLDDISRLPAHVLLHDDGAAIDASAPDWRTWLKTEHVEGIDLTRGPRFDQALMAIEAAIAGQGIALARSTLVSDDLANGRLIHPFGEPRKVLHSYHFVCRPHRLHTPRIQLFLNWLREEAAASAAAPGTAHAPDPRAQLSA
ncbi:transcriptional regulator GcvA [Methylopila sp. Yamaguchi]|uniref:transcriptional regulator GcvA n=1 Tax=Methylopila sp. Yamaguchi TaxID=1437817 RepID=UPI000CB55D33|nr:transcriptional regulator GcvA [Methylopila sp. Yamaguchi]GBD46812.1 LysR family transcriptional regulator [Methylopila sp. Yamaguchi]